MSGSRGGRGQDGQKPKEKFCTLCSPSKGKPNKVPEGRVACLECVPEQIVKVDGLRGGSQFEVCVRALENGKPVRDKKVRFSVEGSSWQTVTTEHDGSVVVQIDYGEKKRKATFVFGSDAQVIEVPRDPKLPKEPDTAQVAPDRSIVASATRQGSEVEILVQTLIGGHLSSLPFFYEIDRDRVRYDKTDDGSKKSRPMGTRVLRIAQFEKPRRARFWVVGKPEPFEIVIEQGLGYDHPVMITPDTRCEITGDVTVLEEENRVDVVVQTYADSVQVPMHFCYNVHGGEFQFACTDNGQVVGADHLVGTTVIQIKGSLKPRKLKIQLIGKNADVQELDLPAIPARFRPRKYDKTIGFVENTRRAIRGDRS